MNSPISTTVIDAHLNPLGNKVTLSCRNPDLVYIEVRSNTEADCCEGSLESNAASVYVPPPLFAALRATSTVSWAQITVVGNGEVTNFAFSC